MAEEAPDSPKAGGKKNKTKFGMMMSGLGRSAKQGMSRASKQMAKGAVKAKQKAVEKIAKVPTSAEDPEIISALERLKITKTEIYAISDIVRNLYEARVNEATFLVQLADKMSGTKVSQNDPFGAYVQQMGSGLAALEQVQSEHLKRMEEELVVPLEKFRDVDVEAVQKLKLKLKSGKTNYDVAAHKVTKAQETNDAGKIQLAQQKRDAAYTSLTQLRNDFKYQVNTLEQKKQVNLLGCMEEYWTSYSSFASAQSSILSQNQIEKQNYAAPPQIEEYEAPQAYADPMANGGYGAGDDMKQETIATVAPPDEEESPPPPANFMDDSPQQGGMPAPVDDGQYEYYEDDGQGNGQTEAFNPFDE